MQKYKLINGWTKKTMLEQIKKKNNGICAINSARTCQYRTEDGNACFAGCFIPDEVYEESMEGILADSPRYAGLFPLEPQAMRVFQQIHDFKSYTAAAAAAVADANDAAAADAAYADAAAAAAAAYKFVWRDNKDLSLRELAEKWIEENVED